MEAVYGIPGGTHDRDKGNTIKGAAKKEPVRSISRTLNMHRDTIKKYIYPYHLCIYQTKIPPYFIQKLHHFS